MALMYVCLVIILLHHLGQKGKAYREERALTRQRQKALIKQLAAREANTPTEEEIKQRLRDRQEAEYRKELEDRGYSEEMITTILPTIMNEAHSN